MEQELGIHIGPRQIKFFMDGMINERLKEYDLSASFAPFILTISENEGISLKEISENLTVDKALSTRVVKRIIEAEYAKNVSDDPRKYSMILTEKGKEMANIIMSILDEAWSILLRDVTPEELECFKTVTKKMANVVKEKMNEGIR